MVNLTTQGFPAETPLGISPGERWPRSAIGITSMILAV